MSDPREIYVEHEGHRIACIAHEHENPTELLPVVWIHGLTMSVRFWENGMFESIARNRSWYSISLPLHYPSSFSGELTKDTLCETLFAGILNACIGKLVPGSEKVHLVGHSLGGFAALNCAAKFPSRIASVISVGGFMTGRAKGIEGVLQFLSQGQLIRKALFFGAFKLLKRHRIFLKLAAYSYARKWRVMAGQPRVSKTLEAVFPDIQKHCIHAQRAFCAYLLEMDLHDEFDDLTTPVLVVVGDRDPIIPATHQIECGLRLDHSRILLLEGVGHLGFAEAPEKFERELNLWLERYDD